MNQLIVLTAPPASGKTFLIRSLIRDLRQTPLVIAPLKALVNECRNNWKGKALVMTPEEWLVRQIPMDFVIIDEFHLNLYWGDTFRPGMWEAFYGILENAKLVILLTATLNTEALDFISTLKHQYECTWIDYGNQRLKNKPKRYFKMPSKYWLEEYVLTLPASINGQLLFCRYREEVSLWEKKLKARGFSVWTCLGGEAGEFSLKVQNHEPPQFIVATTVLSHGVNLPAIKTVYFSYAIQNIDFWVQMVARGGRRGERFEVFSLEKPLGLRFSRISNYLAICWLSFTMRARSSWENFQEWFLKA